MNRTQELIRRDRDALSDVMKLRFYPFIVERGKGVCLYDAEGKEYLDLAAGWGVANVGYGHPRILEAVSRQMEKLSFAGPISAISEESVALAEELTALLPGDFAKKVWYGHSGSDANEFISKIVPLYTGKPKILSFVGAYHGQTMGSYAMSGHPSQSRIPGGGNIVKVPYPYCYRCGFAKEPESCGLFCLHYLEDYIFEFIAKPDQIGAVIVEAIQCDGGDVVPPDGFLAGLAALCKKHEMLFIVDEVKIGFGRTGNLFGFQKSGVIPDAVVMGKPLGGGQPLSAVAGRAELMDAAVSAHLFTTAGNPVACAAARENLRILADEKLPENAEDTGRVFKKLLQRIADRQECVGDVRGTGLVLGMELVCDKKTKKPADTLAAMVVYRAYELGLLHFYTGIFNNVLEFTPPLILSPKQAGTAAEILECAIEDAMSGKVAEEKIKAFKGWG